MSVVTTVYAVSRVGATITPPFDIDMRLSSDHSILIVSSQTDQETIDDGVSMLVQQGWILHEKEPSAATMARGSSRRGFIIGS